MGRLTATHRNLLVRAIDLKAGDLLIHREFARTVTEVTYNPETKRVAVQSVFSYEQGERTERLGFSAHERVKKLEPIA